MKIAYTPMIAWEMIGVITLPDRVNSHPHSRDGGMTTRETIGFRCACSTANNSVATTFAIHAAGPTTPVRKLSNGAWMAQRVANCWNSTDTR